MQQALVSVIGMRTVQHHRDDCYSADCTEYQTYDKIAASGERLNNERRPKRVTVKTNRSEEKDNPKMPNRRVRQCCKDANRKCSVARSSLGCKCAHQPIFFRRTEPVRCLRPIGQIDEHDNAEAKLREILPPKKATAIQQARTIHSGLKARRTAGRR